MKDYLGTRDRSFLTRRVGSISQLAGVKRYQLTDGKAAGVEAVDVKTGSGLEFTVLPGRGMDLAWASYGGVPLSYISKTGVVSPAYYEAEGLNWLRSFFAGLLTTCGLSNVGWPVEDEVVPFGSQPLGLHGRISNMAAENVCVEDKWLGEDDYVLRVAGRLRESMLHGENLCLNREIVTGLGMQSLRINDVVTNEGFAPRPLMILYHINIGYPVLDDGSRFVCNSAAVEPSDAASRASLDQHTVFGPPVNGAPENVYFHDLTADSDGNTVVGIVNDRLALGVYVKFSKRQLAHLTEWKMMGEAEYVLGIEPANCLPGGRVEQRKRGDLESIAPGESREFNLEIGVLADREQIEAFEAAVASLG